MLLQEIKSSLFRQTLKMALRMLSSLLQPSESGVEWFSSASACLVIGAVWGSHTRECAILYSGAE